MLELGPAVRPLRTGNRSPFRLFSTPHFLVAAAGSLFALGYWPAAEHRSTERGLTFFYGLLAASMAILVMARNGVFFLMVWEIMALSAYFLLVTEHEREDVRRAGIVYLIATHTGSAALLCLFSLLAGQSGSFLLPAAGSLVRAADRLPWSLPWPPLSVSAPRPVSCRSTSGSPRHMPTLRATSRP